MRSLKTFFASSLAGSIALVGGGLAAVSAQEATPPPSEITPVVGIHSGTCANFLTEPAYDFGIMVEIPVQGLFQQGDERAETVESFDPYYLYDDGLFDDGLFDDADEGYLSDDLDDDGLFEIGFDEDADGVLAEDEVLGEDLDDDAALVTNELWSPFPVQTVWKSDAEDLNADGTELVNEGPYVVAVHASADNYTQVLACGPVLDLVEEDFVIVPLQPYADSGYFGTAMIQEDEGESAAYLFSDIAADGQVGEGMGGVDPNTVLGDDGVFTEDEAGYLSDDIDDDGIMEIGFDEDEDGMLTDDEVLGDDANEDGELTEDELI